MNTKTNTQPAPLKHLLDNYTTSHPLRSPSPLPPSSRIDPKRSQRLPPPTSSSPLLWTIPTWIAFLQFIIAKGLHIVWSLIKHFLVGPARRSWGYRMTFVSHLVVHNMYLVVLSLSTSPCNQSIHRLPGHHAKHLNCYPASISSSSGPRYFTLTLHA